MKTINVCVEPRAHFSRYIFGSAVYSDTPADIDVAIIYDKQYVSVEEAIAYREEVANKMERLNSMKIDAILLSIDEEAEMSFLQNARHMEF